MYGFGCVRVVVMGFSPPGFVHCLSFPLAVVVPSAFHPRTAASSLGALCWQLDGAGWLSQPAVADSAGFHGVSIGSDAAGKTNAFIVEHLLPAATAESAAHKIHTANASLDAVLNPLGLYQNVDKQLCC